MITLKEKWIEVYNDMVFVSSSDEKRTGRKCDILAFYDLMKNYGASETIITMGEKIRSQVLTYECDLKEGPLMGRYFRWMQTKFDDYDFDNIGLVISDRIDVELMKSYTTHKNYSDVQKYDNRLSEIFEDNPKTFVEFRNSIYKHRSVKIKGVAKLPWQYERILGLAT